MKTEKTFDLEERTAKFAENIIKLCGRIKLTTLNDNIVKQLIRSSTSIGANYCEASESTTKKDFKHKISIAKKEAKETMYWLRIFSSVEVSIKDEIREHWKEARELVLIFAASIRNC